MREKTIAGMITLLDEYPLDTPLQDEWGNHYKIEGVIPNKSMPHLPCLVIIRKANIIGDRIIDLLTLLIDISMDERFGGKNSRMTHALGDTSIRGFGAFSLERMEYRPVLKMIWGYS